MSAFCADISPAKAAVPSIAAVVANALTGVLVASAKALPIASFAVV